MSADVKRARPYRSRVRAEQALRTRARIVEAARDVFLASGYTATAITTIAAAAEVAPDTIYDVFGTKRGLLEAVVRDGVADATGEPEDFLEREWVRELLKQPTLPDRVRSLVRHTARTVARMRPVHALIRVAAASDPALGELHSDIHAWRYASQRQILEAASSDSPQFDVAGAAETFSALTSPELHHLLTRTRGWSEDRYSRWLERTVLTALELC